MKSLERRFNNISRLNPCWSSHICFAESVKGQSFSKRTVATYFNKLVEKDDYDKADKKEIIKHLISLLSGTKNIAEEGIF